MVNRGSFWGDLKGVKTMSKENEDEEEEGFWRVDYKPGSSRKGVIDEDSSNGSTVVCCNCPSSTRGKFLGFSSNESGDGGSSDLGEPQDADYSYIRPLIDELALLILARVPRSEYWKFCFVNKRYLDLVRRGELYDIRREIGIKEPSVFMLASGESRWWAFDRQFTACRKLPVLPSDYNFLLGDKESVCAGTHLLVSGKEVEGVVIWRYELAMNRWYRGPSMIGPRCLFASANCDNVACVAGGIGMGTSNSKEILNTAEKYDPESQSWHPLPMMKRRRKACSGCFMDNKFYVIGGQNEHGHDLTCGEYYDTESDTWELIPDILKDAPISSLQSPPLVAVVNNELYSLEASSNHLKVYMKESNSWKDLGEVPVTANRNRGWGVAFKSLGDELLVIGGGENSVAGHGMTISTCCPDPKAKNLQWRPLFSRGNRLSHFVLNCSVMLA